MKFHIKNGLFNNGILVNSRAIHLAIVNEPYLSYIKKGKKTIETRFTLNRIAPFEKINEGDIVCMKAAGRPVDSFFIAGKTDFFINNKENFSFIRKTYSEEICAEDSFWDIRVEKKFISLIWVKEVHILKNPFDIPKKDKRAWIKFDYQRYENIVLVAGKIGSGKTFWSDRIANEYNCDRASFSSYIKYLCVKNEHEISRVKLQEIGWNVVEKDLENYIYYTLNCLDSRSKNIVIDGLRSVDVVNGIRKYCPETIVTVIYIDCAEEQRKANLKIRGENTTIADGNRMELGVTKLKDISDFIFSFSEYPMNELKKIKHLFSSQTSLDKY